jgi:hypothetical protein
MELEVSAHLRSNCVLINTSKPIREQVAVSVRVRRVVRTRTPQKILYTNKRYWWLMSEFFLGWVGGEDSESDAM